MAAEQEVARRLGKEKTTGAAGKMTQSTIDALVNLNPAVNKAQIEYSELKANIGSLEDQIKTAPEFSAEIPKLKADLDVLRKSFLSVENKLVLQKAAAEVQLSGLENPQEAIDLYTVQEAVQQNKLKRAEADAAATKAAATGAPAAGAGTTTTTPKPPAPPVGVDPLEQVAIDRELKRKEEQGVLVPETNKQWTDTKQKVANILGGPQELMKIADEVFENNVFGISLPADETRLRAQLKLKIINKAGNIVGFNQKSERFGLQTVSRSDVIEALVDDIIRARQSGIAKANAPTAPVESKLKEPGTYTTSK